MSIRERYFCVKEQLGASVQLICVTKNRSLSAIKTLYDLGQRDFGESRVAEALTKRAHLPEDCRWHLIGTLQSNKVSKVVGKFACIHSIDSLKLAKRVSDASIQKGVITEVLLQANTSEEKSKQGLSGEEWKSQIEEVLALEGIQVRGLMTMAPKTDDEALVRTAFAKLRTLRDELQAIVGSRIDLHHLSMGMSSDYPVALEEGATMVRIGSALF